MGLKSELQTNGIVLAATTYLNYVHIFDKTNKFFYKWEALTLLLNSIFLEVFHSNVHDISLATHFTGLFFFFIALTPLNAL